MPTIINGLTGIDKIQNGIINSDDIAAGSVSETKLASNAVTGTKIADGSVSETKLASNAVTGTKIADGSVALSKITPSGTSGQVLTSAGTGSSPTWSTTVGPSSNRIAKAWVNFDGTLSGTITPRASYNVSSVTKNGTGLYTINFTTPMNDANYVVVANCNGVSGTSHQPHFFGASRTISDISTTSCRGTIEQGGSSPQDRELITVAIFGN